MEFFIAQDQMGPVSSSMVFLVPELRRSLIIASDHDMNSSALIATAWG